MGQLDLQITPYYIRRCICIANGMQMHCKCYASAMQKFFKRKKNKKRKRNVPHTPYKKKKINKRKRKTLHNARAREKRKFKGKTI